ncbi:MAG: PepSY domain-containing protein [Woeseiaceae bacterium]
MRFLLIILTFCAVLATPVAAQDFNVEQLLQVAQNDGMSLSQAVDSVRRKTGGRIISAETKRKGGREVHHIKVLTDDGKVKTHRVQGRKRDNG